MPCTVLQVYITAGNWTMQQICSGVCASCLVIKKTITDEVSKKPLDILGDGINQPTGKETESDDRQYAADDAKKLTEE